MVGWVSCSDRGGVLTFINNRLLPGLDPGPGPWTWTLDWILDTLDPGCPFILTLSPQFERDCSEFVGVGPPYR